MSLIESGVIVLHNQPHNASGNKDCPFRESEWGVMDQVHAVITALEKANVPCRRIGVNMLEDIGAILSTSPERLVFNLVEALDGDSNDANHVPTICRSLGRGCTGSDSQCLLLTYDKAQTRDVMGASGIPVPAGIVIPPGADIRMPDAAGRLFIAKPVSSDASEGIDSSCVGEADVAAAAARRIHREMKKPALIEEYIVGREINVSLFERNCSAEVVAIAEIDFSAYPAGKPRILDYASKWLPDTFEFANTPRLLPAKIPGKAAQKVKELALAAWNATGCRDYARVDMRIDENGNPFVLEVNANPDITPGAGFASALEYAGIPYETFVLSIAENSERRSLRGASASALSAATPLHHLSRELAGALIRPSEARDRESVLRMIERTDCFRSDETAVAAELFDDKIIHGESSWYHCYTAETEGSVTGWICFGRVPCTVNAFDIYWIVVTPDRHRNSIGTGLLRFAEEWIMQNGGRLSVIETSSRTIYTAARKFYRKHGYLQAARIADFYGANDDKIIFVKRM